MRRGVAWWVLGAAAAAAAWVMLGSGAAAAHNLPRYNGIARGGIAVTGNTRGLGGVEAGSGGSLGAFVGWPGEGAAPGYPAPSALRWEEGGSAATLALPAGAEILHAELVWAARYADEDEDYAAQIDRAVTLVTPQGEAVSVTPDPVTRIVFAQGLRLGRPAAFYAHSADVTAAVRGGGAGRYGVRGVPAARGDSELDAAGWTLLVAFAHPSRPMRELWIFHLADLIDGGSYSAFIEDTCPSSPGGEPNGTLHVSAMEGDVDRGGDRLQVELWPDGLERVSLASPGHPADNFFTSRIAGSGATFESRNQDVSMPSQGGVRQGWDLTSTTLRTSARHLQPGQTSLLIVASSSPGGGDEVLLTSLGLELDILAPEVVGAVSASRSGEWRPGEAREVRWVARNEGTLTARDAILTLPLPEGLEVAPGGFALDGAPGDRLGQAGSRETLASGLLLGDLAPEAEVEITLRLVASPGAAGAGSLAPVVEVVSQPCLGGVQREAQQRLSPLAVVFEAPEELDAGTPDSGPADVGEDGGLEDSGGEDSGSEDVSLADAPPDRPDAEAPAQDRDQDGLTDAEEARWGTNPLRVDSDGDGLSDGDEVHTHGTSPTQPDTDHDGLSDAAEVELGTDPLYPDTDRDGLPDALEALGSAGTDPLHPDTDRDGRCDGPGERPGICVAGEDLNANGRVDPGERDPRVAESPAPPSAREASGCMQGGRSGGVPGGLWVLASTLWCFTRRRARQRAAP